VRRLALVGVAALCLLGCSTPPFRAIELVSMQDVDPEAMRDEFARALPERFLIVNSVTFEMRGRAFSAIGYTRVDASRESFTVVGLHPAGGLKLFEVSGDSESARCTFALEEFSRWGDFPTAVAEDTRRMYLDRVPGPDARISKRRDRILFAQGGEGGAVEYVFGGSEGVLIEKRYYEGGSRIWSVSYHDYRRAGDSLYPVGIVLENARRGYRLVVRLREIRS
jgi:hypothetical protein